MAEYQIVSRKDIFSQSSTDEVNHTTTTYESPVDLELVEVDVQTDRPKEDADADENDEFDFPLFSFGVAGNNTEQGEEKSTGTGRLMKVLLREPEHTVATQERPKGYYFATYTEDDHQKFSRSAIDYETAMKDATLGPYQGWPRWRGTMVDLNEYNAKIESSLRRQKKLQTRRPSQKQRLAKKMGMQREKERQEKAQEIKKMMKKRFHKRGGKKNKKKAEPVTPRFRTE